MHRMLLLILKFEIDLPTLMFCYLKNMYFINNSYIDTKNCYNANN